jgi:transitional endoplasmic reticulum ATPase
MRLASRWQPAVVFCEDIDRFVGPNRDHKIDQVLNTIDGTESKGWEIIVVLTTNFLGHVNPALLRPGRCDAIIVLEPPDAEAAEKLLRQYGRGLIKDAENLTEVSEALSGCIPAVVREVIERAKLTSILRTEGKGGYLNADILMETIKSMKAEMSLHKKTPPTPGPSPQQVVHEVGATFGSGMMKGLGLKGVRLVCTGCNEEDDEGGEDIH